MNRDNMMSAFLGELDTLNNQPKDLPPVGRIRNRFSDLLWENVHNGHYDYARAEQLVMSLGQLSDESVYHMYEIMSGRFGDDL